MFRGGSGI